MPRKPRYEEAGAIHHVYARGVNRRTIFEDDFDRRTYLHIFGWVVREWKWECLAFCLMSNHVHLLVRTVEPTLGVGMQRLHSLYAQGFNERHARIGHLFQGRYGSSRIRSRARLREAIEYVDQNPVKAGLCASPLDWPWSSRALRAAHPRPRWLLPEAAAATAIPS
jgi:REP element-mobilizing transposase RayT